MPTSALGPTIARASLTPSSSWPTWTPSAWASAATSGLLRLGCNLAQPAGAFEQFTIRKSLVAKLQHIGAGDCERFSQGGKRWERLAAIEQDIQPRCGEALQTFRGDACRALQRVRPIAERLEFGSHLGIDQFAILLETAQALLEPLEARRHDAAWFVAAALARRAYVRSDVGKRIAGGETVRRRQAGQRRRQIVTQFFGQRCQMAIVEDEPQIVLDHPQSFAGAIRRMHSRPIGQSRR